MVKGTFKAGALGIKSSLLSSAAQGAVGSAINQGVGIATGLQSKFNFAGVAASAVGAEVGSQVGGLLNVESLRSNNSIGNHSAVFATSAATVLANAATRSAINGSNFGDNIEAAIPDVIAQLIFDIGINGINASVTENPSKTITETQGFVESRLVLEDRFNRTFGLPTSFAVPDNPELYAGLAFRNGGGIIDDTIDFFVGKAQQVKDNVIQIFNNTADTIEDTFDEIVVTANRTLDNIKDTFSNPTVHDRAVSTSLRTTDTLNRSLGRPSHSASNSLIAGFNLNVPARTPTLTVARASTSNAFGINTNFGKNTEFRIGEARAQRFEGQANISSSDLSLDGAKNLGLGLLQHINGSINGALAITGISGGFDTIVARGGIAHSGVRNRIDTIIGIGGLATGAGSVRRFGGEAGQTVLFGQRRAGEFFTSKKHNPNVPDSLAGRNINDVADDISLGIIRPDQLPIQAFRVGDDLVSINTRTLGALSAAGRKPTVINIIDNPSKSIKFRLKETPIIPNGNLPSTRLPITPSQRNLEVLQIIDIPSK